MIEAARKSHPVTVEFDAKDVKSTDLVFALVRRVGNPGAYPPRPLQLPANWRGIPGMGGAENLQLTVGEYEVGAVAASSTESTTTWMRWMARQGSLVDRLDLVRLTVDGKTEARVRLPVRRLEDLEKK